MNMQLHKHHIQQQVVPPHQQQQQQQYHHQQQPQKPQQQSINVQQQSPLTQHVANFRSGAQHESVQSKSKSSQQQQYMIDLAAMQQHASLAPSQGAKNNPVSSYTEDSSLHMQSTNGRRNKQHLSADAHQAVNCGDIQKGNNSGLMQGFNLAVKTSSKQVQNLPPPQHHITVAADDNLHCDSIEEEVIAAVRGTTGGNVIYTERPSDVVDDSLQHMSQKGGKGGSIIIVSKNAHHHVINSNDKKNYHSTGGAKPAKKITTSQNKFDIKTLVAAGQDGCYSRRGTSSRDRSYPSNSSGMQTINTNQPQYQSSSTNPAKVSTIKSNHAATKSDSNERKTTNSKKSHGGGVDNNQISNGAAGLFASFFSQPKEHYEFLTKTLGCTPAAQSNNHDNQTITLIQKAPGTSKQTQKKGISDNSIIKKETINLRSNDQGHFSNSKTASGKSSHHMALKSNTGSGQQSSHLLYKSFQNQPQTHQQVNTILGGVVTTGPQRSSGLTSVNLSICGNQVQNAPQGKASNHHHQHIHSGSGIIGTQTNSQTVSQQFLQNLKTFTQNYYGAQHEKNKKRQPHQNNQSSTNGKHKANLTMINNPSSALSGMPYKREDIQSLKNSFTTYCCQQQPQTHSGSSRQLKFGQIMEELERFSLSKINNHNNLGLERSEEGDDPMGYGCQNQMIASGEEWAENFTAQSSLCESELEYTQNGNIRASTMKRNLENQEARKKMILEKKKKFHHKSEERKKEKSFFTESYLEHLYFNDKVELELKDFKAEISKKFEQSKLKDFKFPRIEKPSQATRPTRQIKALAPNNPQLYHQRGYSAEEDPNSNNLLQQQRITLGGKNVIFKTTTAAGLLVSNDQKPSSTQIKNKNINVLNEFPAEIIKSQDMRTNHGAQKQQQNLIGQSGRYGSTCDVPSFNDSLNEANNNISQDSIIYEENVQPLKQKMANKSISQHQPNVMLQNFIKHSYDNRVPDNSVKQQQQYQTLKGSTGQNSTKKSNLKAINISHDIMNFHTFDASLAASNNANLSHNMDHSAANKMRNLSSGTAASLLQQNQQQLGNIALHKIVPQEVMTSKQQQQESQIKKVQKQTPKNYSLQLNQVVKKILNDSSGQIDPTQTVAQIAGNIAMNSSSFDQMVQEPSFYTTESYKHHFGGTSGTNHNHSMIQNQQLFFTKDYSQNQNVEGIANNNQGRAGVIGEEEPADEHMLQSYTNVSEHQQKKGNYRTTTSIKKQLKVKRSDSNGSQQKNTLLNKIYRSSKTIKSPQSRQSNMSLNNQNPINFKEHHAIIQGRVGGTEGELVRFIKPSHTVNQSNINSTLSSVRQFHVIQKPQPLSQQRQGSSGMRGSVGVKPAVQKASRLPSSSMKKSGLAIQPGSSLHNNTLSGSNFQADTVHSFHHNPQQSSCGRGNGSVILSSNVVSTTAKDKKIQQQQLLIKSSQIKRTSGERSVRDNPSINIGIRQKHAPTDSDVGKIHSKQGYIMDSCNNEPNPLLDQALAQYSILQRSFHNQQQKNSQSIGSGVGGGSSSGNASMIIQKQRNNNSTTAHAGPPKGGGQGGMKGSVASSPSQQHQRNNAKKSQSLTNKNTSRGIPQAEAPISNIPLNNQGKLVNLGILNQISNPIQNGKGGKITYRNNYQRISGGSNAVGSGSNLQQPCHPNHHSNLSSGAAHHHTSAAAGSGGVPKSQSVMNKKGLSSLSSAERFHLLQSDKSNTPLIESNGPNNNNNYYGGVPK